MNDVNGINIKIYPAKEDNDKTSLHITMDNEFAYKILNKTVSTSVGCKTVKYAMNSFDYGVCKASILGCAASMATSAVMDFGRYGIHKIKSEAEKRIKKA